MECPLLLTSMKSAINLCFPGQSVYIIVSSAYHLIGHPSRVVWAVPFRRGLASRNDIFTASMVKGNITPIKRYANQIQPPDVHNILHSPCVLDPEVPERAKMAFEMKDRLDQLRRSSVRVIVRAGIAIITSYRKPLKCGIAHRHKATAQKQINCQALSVSYALY